MTDNLPTTEPPAEREPLPEITRFPQPHEQQLVDAILRDPLTPAAEHLQEIKSRGSGEPYKSLNVAASRAAQIMKKPVVRQYMELQQERLRRAANIADTDLMQMLTQIMRTDITQVATWDDEGRLTFRPIEELPNHARRAVKKIKQRVSQTKFGETVTTEVELYSVLDAIKQYAEIAGITKGEQRGIHVENGVIYLNPPHTENEALQGKTIHEG